MKNSIVSSSESLTYDSNTLLLSLMFVRVLLLPRLVAAGSVLHSETGLRSAKFYDIKVHFPLHATPRTTTPRGAGSARHIHEHTILDHGACSALISSKG